MTTYHVLGLMSGTSLDGLDIAYVELRFAYKQWHFQILHSETIDYNEDWRNKLKNSISLEGEPLHSLDVEYSKYLTEQTKDFIDRNRISRLDLISSHGHTVKHRPNLGYTLQIGNLAEFGNAFSIPVVCDFRVQDVKLGGQGAPLVPIGDQLLFSEYNYCLNIGGIANISTEKNNQRIAYDICAANIILNHYANELGQEYDNNGKFAASGKLDTALLDRLNRLDYYKKSAPKSLGREWIKKEIFPILETSELSIRDILHTYSIHIAQKINENILPNSRVLVTGGGAHNTFLIQQLDKNIKWVFPKKEWIDYKEALVFGLLGVLRYRNQNNCLKSYTGAIRNHSSGTCYL